MDIPIPDFAVNLGNGLFIDSSGKLTSSVPGNIATFSPSQGLPIPKEAIQDVFGAVGGVLPQLVKIEEILDGKKIVKFILQDEEFFAALGMTKELIETFGKVGALASTIASCIPYVNVAFALLGMFAGLGGSDRIGDLIKEEFIRLRDRLDEADRIQVDNYLATILSTFDPAITAVDQYQLVMNKPKAYQGPGEVKDKRQNAEDKISDVQQALTDALLHNWTLPFKATDYFNWWNYMQSYLYKTPTSGPPVPATFPGESRPFDHRPMVAMLVHGIQTYLTLIKAVFPAHRTTSKYHTALRMAADKLSLQMEKMRTQTLARTIFKAGVPFFRETNRQFYLLAVGAMDLRNDTDDYMRMAKNVKDHPEWDRRGNLYNSWTNAPAIPNKGTHVEVDGDDWWTINPKAVELANKQSERDYAALLARSGYFTLAHLEGLMRHLSTEPDRSETVTQKFKPEVWRKALPAFDVEVLNDQIPFSPPITATASREPQDCKAYITLTTQPIPNEDAIGYRVRLLTLPNGTSETPFDWYVWTDYVPDGPAGTRNRKLAVHVNEGAPLDPVNNDRLLVDNISPETPKEVKRRVKLTADTFDWYIPKPDDPIAFTRINDIVKLGIAAGTGVGAKPIPMPPALPGNGGSFSSARVVTNVDITVGGTLAWNYDQEPGGEKREWKREEVEIDCELYWHEDQMSITLKHQSADRNYVVWLVVEEFLTRSHQWLRTGVRIQFNGQFTYVPQSFFDAEQEAKNRANGIISRIEKKYSVSREPGPLDPVIASIRPGYRNTVEGMQEFLTLASQHAPEIVEEVTAEAASELADQHSAATAS